MPGEYILKTEGNCQVLWNSCRKTGVEEVIRTLVYGHAEMDACLFVKKEFQQSITWQVGPMPFAIDEQTYAEILGLGRILLLFYQGIQALYQDSVAGRQPDWIGEYLELGKTEQVIAYGRMRRFRRSLPLIIRPDILLTEEGLAITELDSVPGGFGLTAELSRVYTKLGYEVIGGEFGILEGFARGVRALSPDEEPVVAIVVSDESQDYRAEMDWIAEALSSVGLTCYTISPSDLIFQEHGLYTATCSGIVRISVLYRFFELFDLKNIPKIDLILYAIRKGLVQVTPPLKTYFEEKLNFALFHHPALAGWWEDWLGLEDYSYLKQILPRTWVMDNRPLPPHGVIPDLMVNAKPVTDFRQLGEASQSGRQFALKVSGFSEKAWGSRGVFIGHDLSQKEWSERICEALEAFTTSPYILQEFRKARQVETAFFDETQQRVQPLQGRVRLCPYYFVQSNNAALGGMLATICPADKKLIHGMVDAVMVPTMVSGR